MGGCGGEIRAKTPEEAWAKFDKEIRPDIENRFGLFLEAPVSRDEAIKHMWQDPQDHAWVLDFYFAK